MRNGEKIVMLASSFRGDGFNVRKLYSLSCDGRGF